MVCPYCLKNKTKIYNSRPTKKINGTWRRRQCLHCLKQFSTTETIDVGTVITVGKKPFSYPTLFLSIAAACDHRDDISAIVEYLTQIILQKLSLLAAKNKQAVTNQDITQISLKVLGSFDSVAQIKYLSQRSQFNSRQFKQLLKATS